VSAMSLPSIMYFAAMHGIFGLRQNAHQSRTKFTNGLIKNLKLFWIHKAGFCMFTNVASHEMFFQDLKVLRC
jgi:hypothetical protein